MTDLTALLEKVRSATGADRELDHTLWLHFDDTAKSKYDAGRVPLPWTWCLTSSIDDALALKDRLLLGWVVDDLSQNSRLAGDPWGCQLGLYHGSNPSKNMQALSGHDFPIAPLAIIAATLQALIAKDTQP